MSWMKRIKSWLNDDEDEAKHKKSKKDKKKPKSSSKKAKTSEDVGFGPVPNIPGWSGPQTRDPKLHTIVCSMMELIHSGTFSTKEYESHTFQKRLDILEGAREFIDAIDVLKRAMLKLTHHPPLWRRLALLYTTTYDNASARQLWSKIAEAEFNPAEANFMLGELAEREDLMPEAAAYYQRALAFDVDYPNVWTRAEKTRSFLPMPRPQAAATIGGLSDGGLGIDPGAGLGIRPPEGFELQHPLGRGGYGTVYLARETALYRDVAIKFLHPHLTRDVRKVEAFFNEARLIARLSIPGVVRIYDLDPSLRVIIMEYLTRGTLRDRLSSGRPLDVRAALRVAAALLKTLSRIHAQGLIHRDIKPENILFRSDNSTVLGDFGVATLETGSIESRAVGTLAYMAPEQKHNNPSIQPIDRRADLYAVGLVLVEMLAGALPPARPTQTFPPSTFVSLLPNHLRDLLKPTLLMLLSTNPDDRASDALDVYRELVRVYRNVNHQRQGDTLYADLERIANLSGAPDPATQAFLNDARRALSSSPSSSRPRPTKPGYEEF